MWCCILDCRLILFFFFFNDTATTEIYTLSLHDALPISNPFMSISAIGLLCFQLPFIFNFFTNVFMAWRGKKNVDDNPWQATTDRKSTRLNSSHGYISYAVFCLKKKKNITSAMCKIGQPL